MTTKFEIGENVYGIFQQPNNSIKIINGKIKTIVITEKNKIYYVKNNISEYEIYEENVCNYEDELNIMILNHFVER